MSLFDKNQFLRFRKPLALQSVQIKAAGLSACVPCDFIFPGEAVVVYKCGHFLTEKIVNFQRHLTRLRHLVAYGRGGVE